MKTVTPGADVNCFFFLCPPPSLYSQSLITTFSEHDPGGEAREAMLLKVISQTSCSETHPIVLNLISVRLILRDAATVFICGTIGRTVKVQMNDSTSGMV